MYQDNNFFEYCKDEANYRINNYILERGIQIPSDEFEDIVVKLACRLEAWSEDWIMSSGLEMITEEFMEEEYNGNN